jgi:molecular chaperone GrpE
MDRKRNPQKDQTGREEADLNDELQDQESSALRQREAADYPAPEGPLPFSVESDDDLAALRARAAERDEYLRMLQRAQADLENYRKRIQRDMESERQYAGLPFVRDLLPVVDNVERALEAARTSDDLPKLIAGIELVRTQLFDVLVRHGVEPIDAVGQPFDPNRHDALLQRPDRDRPERTVLEVVEKGYQMHDRVVRPSKVVVSALPEPDAGRERGGDS